MGTKMQSETYFSRHCRKSFRRSINTGRWSPYQEGKVLENSKHEDSSSPLSGVRDRYSGHDKARVKEAILEHEALFKHQVRELHRLYRRQRELMNVVQENKLGKFQKKAELSQSVIFPSFLASGTAKRTLNESPFLSSDTMIARLDPSRSIAGQSPCTVLKRNQCDSFNPCRDMYLHKPADLHIAGDAHKYKEKTTVEGSSFSLVGNGVGCEDRTNDPLRKRASNSFCNNTAKYHVRAGDSESNVRMNGRNYLAYLSEPIQFLRSSSSVKSSCNLSCNTDTLKRQDLTANVSLNFSPKTETSQYSMPVMNGQNFLSRPPSGHDSNRKEQKSYGFKFRTDLALDIENKTEGRKKRKIFGVEIAEVDESPLVSSDANNSYPKSNGAESDTSGFLSTRASVRLFSRMASSPQGSHGVTTSEPSWLKLGSCLQNLEFVGGTDARDASKSSVPKSNLFDISSSCVHPQQNPLLIDGGAAVSLDILNRNHAFTSLPDLFEFNDSSDCLKRVNSEQMKSSRILKFNSEIANTSEIVSQHFFNTPERSEIPSKEFNLEKSIKHAVDEKDGHAIEKRVGFPADAVSKKIPIQHVENPNVAGKSLSNYISGSRNHIDLNLSIVEEETPATVVPLAVMKSHRPEIGLGVAAVIESEVKHGGAKSLDKSECHENLIEEAAEALVVMSSPLTKKVANYATCHLENTSSCLHWFADLICSYISDEDGGIMKISEGIDGCCDEEVVSDGIDYFEFMTLQLKGVKEETREHQKPEETIISATTRRYGRGCGRRGRQQKDFQKDVLPDLVSLAKQEVVEDLQTLKELFHSTGKTWKSSLTRKNGAKNGRKGIKSGDSINTTKENSALLRSKQKQNGRELQLRGKRFTGWGKRTQRLPRQRCSKKSCSSIQLLTSA